MATVKFFLDGVKLPVRKCKRPSFKCQFGRTWDHGYVNIDDVKHKAHLDTSWGNSIYFQYGEDNQWYSLRMMSKLGEPDYHVDPFERPVCEIKTF